MVFSVLLRGDLGERKVKFRSKRAISRVICFFSGVCTLFGNQPPHPSTFGRYLPKKHFFGGAFPKRLLMQLMEQKSINFHVPRRPSSFHLFLW